MEPLGTGDPRRAGPYRLEGRLGGGGMGQVFLGRSPAGRVLAVKVIRPELAADPGFAARFRREVAAARAVSGFYTAPVVDADPEADPPWLATAYVPGPSLSQAIREHGPMPAASLLPLAAGLAEALASVHAAGVVHRDVKPTNVLLAVDGPRLIDFGISQAADATSLTETGMVIGSAGFMPPEQVEGGAVGPPGDVFSLGAVLVYAATGSGPFGSGAIPALLYRVVHAVPNLDWVPVELRELVMDCLAKDPAQRPSPLQIVARAATSEPATTLVHASWFPAQPTEPVGESASGPQETVPPVPALDSAPHTYPAEASPGVGEPPTLPAVAILNGATVPAHPLAGTPARSRPGRRRFLIGAAATVLAATGTGVWVWAAGDSPAGARGASSVAFSPDGRILASDDLDDMIQLWSVTGHARLAPLGRPFSSPTGFAAFVPDGRTLVSGGGENVQFWNVTDPTHPTSLGSPLSMSASMESMALSPDGHTIAFGGDDGQVRLWRVANPADPTFLSQIDTGHTDFVHSVAFSSDGRTLASGISGGDIGGGNGGIVQLWNITDPTHPASLAQPLATTYASSISLSPDGHTLAIGGVTVQLWDLTDILHPVLLSPPPDVVAGDINSVAFSPDGHTLASANGNGVFVRGVVSGGTVQLWNVTDPTHPVTLRQETPTAGYINSVSFSPDGHTLAGGGIDDNGKASLDQLIQLWSLN